MRPQLLPSAAAFSGRKAALSCKMPIQAAGPVSARALCLALCLAATAPQASAFRLGALITRARAPEAAPEAGRAQGLARRGRGRPAAGRGSPPWLDAAFRLAKRDAEAFVPELHATLTRHESTRRRGATLKDVSAAVSQRATQWAETRAPFARWTAAHYGVPIDAPQLGEALRRAEEYLTAWKSNFRRPRHRRDVVLNTGTRRDGSRAASPSRRSPSSFARA